MSNQLVDSTHKKRGAPFGNKNGVGNKGPNAYKSVIERRLAERRAIEQIADRLIDDAIAGDKRAVEILFDRVMGKAVSIVAGDNDGGPIKHEYALSDSTRQMLAAMRQIPSQANNDERVIDAEVVGADTE